MALFAFVIWNEAVPARRPWQEKHDFSLVCVCVGCVCHSCVPVRDAGHPAGQGLDSTRSLAGCGLLPETRLQPPHTPAGTTVVVHTHGLLNTNIRNTLHNYTHFRDYPNTTFSKHRSDVQLIKVPSTRAKTIFSPPFSFDAFREYFRKNTVVYRVAKSCPFHWSPWDPWDMIWMDMNMKNMNVFQCRESHYFLVPVFISLRLHILYVACGFKW